MRIIKSGRLEHVMACDRCGCVIEIDKDDIEYAYILDGEKRGPYVECPECGRTLPVKYSDRAPQEVANDSVRDSDA